MKRILIFSCVVFMLAWLTGMFVSAPAAHAATLTVQSAADDGTTNAANCPGVNCRLRDAIAAAPGGDTINFGGDYSIALADTLTITKNLTIDGTGHSVVISGDTDSDGVFDVQAFAVNVGVTARVKNLAITLGFPSSGKGGGIYNRGALTVSDTLFSTNYVAIYNETGATLDVLRSTFTNNMHGGYSLGSGGILNTGTLTVTDSAFSGNLSGLGSAIANYGGGTAWLTASSFNNNRGGMIGGAVYNYASTMTVNNCTFSNNSQEYGYFGGGAILNYIGNLTVTGSTFSGNTSGTASMATYYGLGGAIATLGNLTVTGSTFDGNTSWGVGGAISAMGWADGDDTLPASSIISLTNNTFRGNNANVVNGVTFGGGAVYLSSNYIPHILNLTNNTFSGNGATTGGNLAFKQDGYTSSMAANAYNNIVQGATSGGNCARSGTMTIIAGNNLADDATCGAGFTNSSGIALGTFGNYGGNTKTFPLAYNSVAIDAANATFCPAADQRGKARNDLQCDIGAFEYVATDGSTVLKAPGSASMTTFGPALTGIQYGGSAPGATTVTKAAWAKQKVNAIGKYWDLTPTNNSGLNATLKLCYLDSESNGRALASLSFWRSTDGGATFSSAGAPTSTNRDANGNNCATLTGVNAFSRWTLATGNPTAATLNKFNARFDAVRQRVTVNWTTLSEINVVGFNIWRQTVSKDGAGKGGWQLLNKQIIVAKQAGEQSGSKYSGRDKTVKAGKTYAYKLEIVFADGRTEWSEVKRVAVKSQ